MEFRVLGPLQVLDGGHLLDIPPTGKRATLLAALLIHHDRVVPAERLIGWLWGEEPSEAAAATLRGHVWRLRGALKGGSDGNELLLTRGPGYELRVPPETLDALRFENDAEAGRALLASDPAAAASTLREALCLWRGRALEGFEEQPFARGESLRLEELRLGAVEDLMEAELALGREAAIIGELQSLVADHPTRERLIAQLVRALYHTGRQAEALSAYGELRRRLVDELGIEPSPELRQLERAVLRQELGDEQVRVPTSRRGVGVEPQTKAPLPPFLTEIGRIFVGRDGELERLRQLWTEVTAGRQRAVLVGGEPGVGKTRVAAELAGRVHTEGALVLAGRCDEDLGVPYQPFVEALRHFVDHTSSAELANRLGRYQGELARLLPDLGQWLPDLPSPLRSDPETERYRLFDAVAGWLVAASAAQPVLLVLDDLQWAAKPTLLLLRHVLRSSEPMRLLVLATYRDTEVGRTHPVSELLAELRRSESVERIPLRGLAQPAVAAFLEEAAGHELGAEKDELARVVHRETEGNAFFVREVVRHLIETGGLVQREGRWVTGRPIAELGIPEGVRDVVGQRLSRLSGTTNQALSLAAVVGEEFELAVVERAGTLDEDALLSALDEAGAARLISEVPGPVARHRFAHALVRATLYDELTGARRAVLHRRVAEVIESLHAGQLDDHLPALAHHFARASTPQPDIAKAVDYAVLAGNRALAQLAHDEAVLYYRQALDLLDAASVPPGDRRRMDVLIALGEAQRRAGDPAFRETLLGVARMAQEYGDDDALIRAALATNRGVWSAVWTVDRDRVAVLEAALVAAGSADSAARARLLADLGAELAFSGEPSRRLALTGEAIRIARDLGDPVTLAHCLIARCAATFVDPDSLADSLGTTAELVETADRLRDPFIRAWGRYHRYWATFQAGRREEADEALGAFERAAIEAGQPRLRWASTLVRAGRSIAAASLSEAEEIGRKVRDDIVFFSEPDAPSFFGTLRYVIRYEQGRLDELIPRLEVTARTTDRAAAWALLALAYCELERGDQARRVWERLATTVGDTSIGPVGGMVMAPAAEVCARLGDTVAAAKLYELLLPHADQIAGAPVGWFGPVAHFLGLLAATLGRVEDAERHFADAEATNERMAAPSWLARTRLEWGRMLVHRGGTGDADRARALLREALAAAQQLGLGTVERRAAAILDQHT